MSSDRDGTWQQFTNGDTTTRYHVNFVIGSGTHASGYLTQIDDRLFQSPVAYYISRSGYGLAPGFEGKTDPDFTRPVGEGCLFCHAGSFTAVEGTQNQFAHVPFKHLSISCDRCHGPTAEHLRKPIAENIVNPENLHGAARDSVCEQCHLIGAARVLNPGKKFTDFRAGQPLEDTFTIFHYQMPAGTERNFKVISHSEQLALSACARNSKDALWCGTCHDPHAEPQEPVSFYRERCLSCHAKTKFATSHPALTSNCIGCHMPKRDASDGGHTAFTDHRIQRRPVESNVAAEGELAAWRQPALNLAQRNLGIASIEVGLEQRSAKSIVSGYRMLAEAQPQFSEDSELYNMIGTALLLGGHADEAVRAFELAVRYDPRSSPKETNLGKAYIALGQMEHAQQHLQTAIALDELDLDAVESLVALYDKSGNSMARDQLSKKLASIIANSK